MNVQMCTTRLAQNEIKFWQFIETKTFWHNFHNRVAGVWTLMDRKGHVWPQRWNLASQTCFRSAEWGTFLGSKRFRYKTLTPTYMLFGNFWQPSWSFNDFSSYVGFMVVKWFPSIMFSAIKHSDSIILGCNAVFYFNSALNADIMLI